MLFKSQVLTQASGSVGGLTFSHNRSGMYTRGRSIPTNPSTNLQSAVRNIFANLAQAWSSVLTQFQREAWTLWAVNNPVVNKLGDPLTLTGQQMYIRNNTVRVQAGLTRIDPGPIIQGAPSLTPPVLLPVSAPTAITASFDNTDTWANETGGALIVFTSQQKGVAINFHNGPFRIASTVLGDPTTPPTSPTVVADPFFEIFLLANVLFGRFIAVSADGRISTTVKVRAAIV